jgi:hypothetical protein
MFDAARGHVQGLQVSAPFGKVPFALRVFDGLPGIDAQVPESIPAQDDALGFAPPAGRSASSVGTPRVSIGLESSAP